MKKQHKTPKEEIGDALVKIGTDLVSETLSCGDIAPLVPAPAAAATAAGALTAE
jgi:hypothetical protein